MPPTASKQAPKRKAPAFKPPRPAKAAKATKAPKTVTIRRKSAPARNSYIASDPSDNDDAIPSPNSRAASESNSASASEVLFPTAQEPPPTIPPALLTRLLHHHFHDEKTRIGKDAKGVVGKYMETFVREAIARAAFERGEALEKESGGGIAGDFLEVSKLHVKETVAQNVGTGLMMRGQVEDLEKLAPQLLLDF